MMKLRNLAIALSVILIFQSFLPHISSALDIDVFATIDGLRCNGSSGDPVLPMLLLCGYFPGAFPIRYRRRITSEILVRSSRRGMSAHMQNASDAPHTEQRSCAFPKPANGKSPRPLYILQYHAMPSLIDRSPDPDFSPSFR